MRYFYSIKKLSGLLLLAFLFAACSDSDGPTEQTSTENEAQILLHYLEENGNIVNHPSIPFLINAEEVYNNLRASNYLVIDVRSPRDFFRGHIENAVNIQPDSILDYFENRIEPNSFEKIVVVCNNAHLSGYAVAILRMLGYDNTFNMRFGMSSWHDDIARRFWYANISDDLEGNLETASNPKNAPGTLPQLSTGNSNGYEILRERAQKALSVDWQEVSVDFMDILEEVEDYYVINYWPEALYNQGHLPGAIQYNPKKSLHSNEDLLTLPIDQPIVVYCFSGHHAVYVNAFLSVMGYEFRSLDYGANSFIHQTMVSTQPPGRSFTEMHVKNFPLVKASMDNISTEQAPPAEQIEETTVQGGC